MAQTYAQRVNDEISRFFDDYFPRKFKRYEPVCQNMFFAYYCNFPVIGVSIVIFTPLFKGDNDELSIASKRHIRVVLKETHKAEMPYLIELTDTMIKGLWRDRLNERVSILLELMDTQTIKCDACNIYMTPKTRRTRKDKKRTQFVTMQCPVCYKYKSTEYGMGVKTILHRNLKKKRTR
ncbi:MAG: hypothetical protein U9Q12_01215 [Patescibacteria group bacterium]|nr:hypothetical protein [Patescibacteria group bacterium]